MENVREQIVTSPNGFVIFHDMVLDKAELQKIELVRAQWSGNAKQVIRGIGVVTCVYVNPETDQFWIIDYRIFAPETDQKSKLDHMREMLANAVHQKHLPFRVVLMDTWYAAKNALLFIEKLGKVYYCPIRENRLVSLHREEKGYHRVDSLLWSQDELRTGRLVHLRDFPAGHQVKLFRLTLSTGRTLIVTIMFFIISCGAPAAPNSGYVSAMAPAVEQLAKWKIHYGDFETLLLDTGGSPNGMSRLEMLELYNMATQYKVTRDDYINMGFLPLDILVGDAGKFAREGQSLVDALSAATPDKEIEETHQAILKCVQTRVAFANEISTSIRDLQPVDLSGDVSPCSNFDADLEKLTAYVNEHK